MCNIFKIGESVKVPFMGRDPSNYEHKCETKCACGADAEVSQVHYLGKMFTWVIRCSDPNCPLQYDYRIHDGGEPSWHGALRDWNKTMGNPRTALLEALLEVNNNIKKLEVEIREGESYIGSDRVLLVVPIPPFGDHNLQIKVNSEDMADILNRRRVEKEKESERAVKLAQLLARAGTED